MMNISRKVQSDFYKIHARQQEEEYRDYLLSDAFSLYQSNKLYAGIFLGIDKSGNVLVRFKTDKLPRKNMVFTSFTLPEKFNTPIKWEGKRYIDIRKTAANDARIGGTGIEAIVSDAHSIYFAKYKEDPNWIIAGFSQVEMKLVEILSQGEIVVFARKEPPIDYLLAMQDLSLRIKTPNPILDFDTDSKTSWNPKNLKFNDNIPNTISEWLSKQNEIMIQGPPGTGKTYLMSQLCQRFIEEGNSVMVTAQSNQALVELAQNRDNLKNALDSGNVFKTSLSSDEKKKIPEIQSLNEISPIKGRLHLSTYYKLSKVIKNYPHHPVYDILILEEASQAYLTTIASFRLMTKKIIIVGDPLQLPPAWREELVNQLHPLIHKVANGLVTYAHYSNEKSFRLTESHRLPVRAAKLTGTFYEDSLVSVAKHTPPFKLVLSEELQKMLHPMGGSSLYYINMDDGGKKPMNAIDLIARLSKDFLENNPSKKLAIVSPFVETNKVIQATVTQSLSRDYGEVVETIDRIQGLTSDFTLLLIPFDGMYFSFDINRFNVATSRSKTHTLIIIDEAFNKHKPPGDSKVLKYLERAKQ